MNIKQSMSVMNLKNDETEGNLGKKKMFKSAFEVLEEEQKSKSISTGSRMLDKALGNGLRLGTILEVYGLNGSGKTQLALSLMINTILPASTTKINGEVVYISTKRNFCPQRVNELIENAKMSKYMTKKKALKRIHHRCVKDVVELIKTIYQLHKFVKDKRKSSKDKKVSGKKDYSRIRLLIVDSFATHLQGFESIEKTRLSHELLHILSDIAKRNNCAIVLTNDMVEDDDGEKNYPDFVHLKPNLGDEFSHLMPQRIYMVKAENDQVVANVEKSLCHGPSLLMFQITARGIEDNLSEDDSFCTEDDSCSE